MFYFLFLGAITCHAYKISPSDFVGSWIAFCVSHQIDANDLNKDNFAALVKSVKIEKEELKSNEK